MQGKIRLSIGLVLLALVGFSQEIKVTGGFLNDHFKIGEEVQFWMSARYPLHVNLLFPDSTYTFGSFEYVSKTYYKSEIQNGQVVDTVLYKLQSFEIDPVQYLKLPATILYEKDSTQLYTTLDSMLLQELAPIVSDTTQLKTNLKYAEVPKGFNYPLLWIIIGVLILAGAITIIFFGKKIRLAFKLRRMKKEYIQFSDYLTEQIHLLKVNPQPTTAEAAMTEWKKYFEKLEKKPFSKFTSKEILQLEFTSELKEPLGSIDKCVYGGRVTESIYKEFQSIEDFTQHRYGRVIEALKNGN